MSRTQKVTDIIDGSIMEIGRDVPSIRLANVFATERGQKGYGDAKARLVALTSLLTKGSQVTITPLAIDVYGRTVADVKVGNKSVNKAINDYLNGK